MATDANKILHQIVERQLKAGRFTAASAADAAIAPIAKLDGLRPLDIPNLRPIAIDGLKYRAKQYHPAINGAAREAANDRGQGDFSEVDPDFERMLWAPAALDELEGTQRLPPIQMNLEQLRLHIALKRRKASQAWRNADQLERLLTEHREEWEAAPALTLGEILYGADRGHGGGHAA